MVVNRLVEKEGEEEDEEEEDVSSEDSTRLAIDARRNIIVCVCVCKNVYNFLLQKPLKFLNFHVSLSLSHQRF